ncbi:hypothetical protein C8R45DRAFT_939547 [Mycena sanguinolenta]|nr:hypothetical protein C8R45DRAFT_942929 [Mycena sanguinolenta]KAJ6457906.1 hypothetical protein C8R45DRAFT_942933 [Mycena sanguinolenta]KAJ6465339.1 hypothetical protein C8R45DRAFT_939547 [Mycena sanguinolenta]
MACFRDPGGRASRCAYILSTSESATVDAQAPTDVHISCPDNVVSHPNVFGATARVSVSPHLNPSFPVLVHQRPVLDTCRNSLGLAAGYGFFRVANFLTGAVLLQLAAGLDRASGLTVLDYSYLEIVTSASQDIPFPSSWFIASGSSDIYCALPSRSFWNANSWPSQASHLSPTNPSDRTAFRVMHVANGWFGSPVSDLTPFTVIYIPITQARFQRI